MNNYLNTMLFVLFFSMTTSAQFIYVEPGDGTLKEAIARATENEAIILKRGGVYTESEDSTLIIDKRVTISAEDGSTQEPIITNTKYRTGRDTVRASIFTIKQGGQLTVKYCDFNGLKESDTTTFRALGDFVYIDPSEMSVILSVIFEGCIFRDATGHLVNGTGDGQVPAPMLLNLSFGQCLLTNSKGIKFREVSLQTIGFDECTAWNIKDYLLNFENNPLSTESNADPATVGLSYSTFDNIGDGIAKAVNASGMWIIDACIFSNQPSDSTEMFSDLSGAMPEVTNCNFYNIGTLGIDESMLSDCLYIDPEYADPANGDFTLPGESVLLTASSNGNKIGDPRWAQGTTAIEDPDVIVTKYSLEQNYPNPFNPTTTISFFIKEREAIELKIYNCLGEIVEIILDEYLAEGQHSFNWNAKNLPSGIYYYQLVGESFSECRKMMLIK
nr:DUF5123 domain-containing protein [uncultured Sphaerochaeta sp.]